MEHCCWPGPVDLIVYARCESRPRTRHFPPDNGNSDPHGWEFRTSAAQGLSRLADLGIGLVPGMLR